MYTISLSLSLVATATTGITLTDAAAACSPPASLRLLAGLSTLTLTVEEWCPYISCTETIICPSFFICCYFLQCAHLKLHKATKPQNPRLLLSIALRSPVKRGSDSRRGWGSLCWAGKKKETKKKQMLFFLLLDFSSRKPQTKLEKINKSRTSWEALSALCVSSASFPSLPPFLSSLNLKSLK